MATTTSRLRRPRGQTPRGRRIALGAGAVLLVLVVSLGVLHRREIWTAYVLWRDFDSLGRNGRGYREYRHRPSGVTFVLLPGGAFTMGSAEGEEGFQPWEQPQHEVTVSSFLIAKWEIREAQWEAVMGERRTPPRGDDFPICGVSWQDCQDFCSRTGLRLPTEAQWEYACRAGTTTRFWSGDSTEDLRRVARFHKMAPLEVGRKPANSFGLHDTHGNVSEWCEDRFDRNFYKKAASRGRNPLSTSCTDPGDDRFRVIRGGDWNSGAHQCRSAYRIRMDAGVRMERVGFRPVYRLP